MTYQRPYIGPRLRQNRLDAGVNKIAQLLAAPDPLSALREVDATGLLGPVPGSPFARGSKSVSGLLEILATMGEGLPDLEAGISRPRLALRVAVIEDHHAQKLLAGAAEVIGLSLTERAVDDSELQTADLVILTPDSVGDPLKFSLGARGGKAEDRRQTWTQRLLDEVIPVCRRFDIPIIFWDQTTRDSTPAGRRIAAACDHVFAVSEGALERYSTTRDNPTEVSQVPIAVNPLQHSPLGSRAISAPVIAMADAQLAPQIQDLAMMAGWLLDGIQAQGVPALLLRRDQSSRSSSGHGAGFPVRHWEMLAEHPGAAKIAALDRVIDVGLVLNEVVSSQTLYDRRVVELQASGSMVLSSYNQGVNSYLPHVYIPQSADDVADTLGTLTVDDLRRTQNAGIRTAFCEHHVSDVLDRFCASVGIIGATPRERALAVAESIDPVLREEFSTQTYADVPLVTWDQVGSLDGTYDILLPTSTRRHYSPTYVSDHVAAFRYQGASVSLKLEGPLDESGIALSHSGTRSLEGLNGLDLSAWWRPRAEVASNPAALDEAAPHERIFNGDQVGHHVRDRNASTRRPRPSLVIEDDVAAGCHSSTSVVKALQLELTVIVPVFNNGDHLRHKAFASLRRSSVFEKMHVILVNDGSTDPVTVDTIEEFAHRYPNVMAFHHAAGGSGSASRPRNTGLVLAQTEFVTYLDPDNETVEDGYAKLLADLKTHQDVDFVLGDMTYWGRRFGRVRYSELARDALIDHADDTGSITVPSDALEQLKFRPMSIQAMVARTFWLKSRQLIQPVGAVGQDSFFFQQMLYYARRIRVSHTAVHTYYSAVSDSTVNTINPRYFEKYRPLDLARSSWLREIGKLDSYRELRLEPFFVSWMLPKLRRLESDRTNWLFAAETLAETIEYYGEHDWSTPQAQKFWTALHHERHVK